MNSMASDQRALFFLFPSVNKANIEKRMPRVGIEFNHEELYFTTDIQTI